MWAPEVEWGEGGGIPCARLEDLAHTARSSGMGDRASDVAHRDDASEGR